MNRRLWRLVMPLAIAAACSAAPPAVDKAKLEAYLRYAEGFMDNVHFNIEDPSPSEFPNFYRLRVHLSTATGAKLERTYFITPDGRQIVNGSIWDLNRSPFAATEAQLPTSGYSFGPPDAKVKLVIFSDFQCPYCREYAQTVRENVSKDYPKQVEVIFRDFPIDSLHPWARAAAEASHCVADQNPAAFWSYHDWIFAHADGIKPDNLKDKVLAWAKEQKLDDGKLAACMDGHLEASAVAAEEKQGKALQVQQTPTSFVNGRMAPGALPWANLDSIIQLELKRPATLP